MKTLIAAKTFAALLFVVVVVAPSPSVSQTASGTEEDKEELRKLARLFEESVRQRDLKKFQAVLAPDFVGTLVTSENVNRESMAKFWDWVWGLLGPKGRWESQVVPEATRFFGDIAVSRGVTNDHLVTEKGREYRYSWNWTVVLQKRANRWTPIAGHGSMDPLGNVFVKADETWIKTLFGGAGAFAGLVVGGGLMGLAMRRRVGRTP